MKTTLSLRNSTAHDEITTWGCCKKTANDGGACGMSGAIAWSYSSVIKHVCMYILTPAGHQVLKYTFKFALSITTALKRGHMFAGVTLRVWW